MLNNSSVKDHLDAAKENGVQLAICGIAMRIGNISADRVRSGVKIVSAGVAEIMDKQESG